MNIQLCVIDTDASVLKLKHNLQKVQCKIHSNSKSFDASHLEQHTVLPQSEQHCVNKGQYVGKVLGNVSRLVQFGIPQLLNCIVSYIKCAGQNDFLCNKLDRIYCNIVNSSVLTYLCQGNFLKCIFTNHYFFV